MKKGDSAFFLSYLFQKKGAVPSSHAAKFVFFLVLILFFLFLGKFFHFNQESYKNFLNHFPLVLSGIIFVILYVVVTFFVWIGAKDLFRITAAVVYGHYLSSFLVWLGEMGNAVVLFSMSRNLGRGFVESKMPGGLKRWDHTISETGFWSIFWLRFFPLIPFRFLDLGFGLTGISLKKYFFISLLATPLRIFWLQFFLSLGFATFKDPNRLAVYLQQNPGIFLFSFLYAVGSIVMMFVLRKKYRIERK